jgi:hypothetical protein
MTFPITRQSVSEALALASTMNVPADTTAAFARNTLPYAAKSVPSPETRKFEFEHEDSANVPER